MSHGLGIGCNGAPEIGHKSVKIIDGFNALAFGCCKQNRQAPRERFDVIFHLAEGLPYLRCGA